MSSKGVVADFRSSLCDLTVNSKPHINMLTMLAEDYIEEAPAIVEAIEDQLRQVSGEVKLPVLYLIDSIIKNVGKTYTTLFNKNIVTTFAHAFERVDVKAKTQMYKLRQTWQPFIPLAKLYALDLKINSIDKDWPITATPTNNIHVNPKFLNSNPPAQNLIFPIAMPDKNQQELLKQKQELIELQKRKEKLEMQQQAILEEQTKKTVVTTKPPVKQVKIPPVANILTRPKLDAPIKTRDPRLRKELPKKDTEKDPPAVEVSPRTVLSPVPSPSNSQQTSSSSESPSKPKSKKTKKSRETRSSKAKSDDKDKTPKDVKDKPQKLSRAAEVLKIVEEQKRLSKIEKIGSDSVINKAKQLGEKSKKSKNKELPVEAPTKQVEVPAPPPPPIISALPHSPEKPASPKTVDKVAPKASPPSNCMMALPEDVVVDDNVPERSSSKTPSPTRIRKIKDRSKRNYKRKRQSSLSPSNVDVPPETTDPPEPKTIAPETEALLDSGQDTDLRLLTAKSMDLESSPAKKSKTETLEDLFGKEDVDLRALPPPPPVISRPSPPRSPPTPSKSTTSPERQKSWANLKRSNSDVSPDSSKRPFKAHDRRKSDRFVSSKDKDVGQEEMRYDDPTYEETAKERTEMIMRNAEEQLSNGNISFAQYNNLLKEVVTMNEKRKLQEAMRLDQDAEDLNSSRGDSPERDDAPFDFKDVSNKRRRFQDAKRPPNDFPDPKESSYHREPFDDVDRRVPHEFPHFIPPVPTNPWNNPPHHMRSSRVRDKFGRWSNMPGPARPPFDSVPSNFNRFTPPVNNFNNVIPPHREIPPADPAVLDAIAKDPMKTIIIDSVPREIRFYGETAVIMMSWDDPRELTFQPGQRHITFNDRETFPLHFNAPYMQLCVDGLFIKVRLGAPTRELFIDGVFYEVTFGGPPIKVRLGNRMFAVRLGGPLPTVKIGTEVRKDLVAGKITLIVDGNDMFPIYLDAKPQRFVVGGVPYILRFVEALQTVVINGVPFKIPFGSNLPVPMYFHGEKHYLRFSNLPGGIKPGYITIINMEGGRLASPPPLLPPPMMSIVEPPMMSPSESARLPEMMTVDVVPPVTVKPDQDKPIELLSSLMPTNFIAGIGQGYAVEENSNHMPESGEVPVVAAAPSAINVGELLSKLIAVGIVPGAQKKEDKKEEVPTDIVPVCFDRPESLKTKQPGLVHTLYSGMQCSSCGVRFPPEQTGKYSQHLDWHFRQNRRERDAMRVAQSRKWNYDVSDWIQYQEIEEKEDRAQSWFEIQEKNNFEVEESPVDEPSVPAGEKGENACCEICQDKFDQFYNEEKEEWHLKKAMEVDGQLYHPVCYQDREEKLASSVLEVTPIELDKSVLLVPPEPEELIEINDDAAPAEPVLGMAIDDEEPSQLETIDLESEPSNSKDGEDQKDEKEGDEVEGEEKKDEEDDDDDDILAMEVLENKIETFELSDEEKEEDEEEDKVEDEAVEDDLQVDLSRVKKEKVEVVDLDAQTTQPTVTSSIDGNVELDDAAPVSLPKRIIINIPSAITRPLPVEEPTKVAQPVEDPPNAVEDEPILPEIPPILPASSEPPPPGEELIPIAVKPRISSADLEVLKPVNKGSELSGLCCIM